MTYAPKSFQIANADSLNSQTIQRRTRIQIPQSLHQVPIISALIRQHQLTVNIRGAVLDQKATGGGWFDLVLEGEAKAVKDAIQYLQELGVEIWHED